MNTNKLLELVLENLEAKKAEKIISLDIRKLTDIADHMVICSATSSRHVKALANNLVITCKEHGIKPLGVEDSPRGEWTLVDLTDIIVHIMLPPVRELYNLEQLWSIELVNEARTNNDK